MTSTKYLLEHVDELSHSVSSLQRVFDCPICLDMLNDPVRTTTCGHTFCKMCIKKVLRKHTKEPCPICKSPLTHRSIVEDEKMATFLEISLELITAISMDAGVDITNHSAKKVSTNEASQNSEEFFKKKSGVDQPIKKPIKDTSHGFQKPPVPSKVSPQTKKEKKPPTINTKQAAGSAGSEEKVKKVEVSLENARQVAGTDWSVKPETVQETAAISRSLPQIQHQSRRINVPFYLLGPLVRRKATVERKSSVGIFSSFKTNKSNFHTEKSRTHEETFLQPVHQSAAPRCSSVCVQTSPIKPVQCDCEKKLAKLNFRQENNEDPATVDNTIKDRERNVKRNLDNILPRTLSSNLTNTQNKISSRNEASQKQELTQFSASSYNFANELNNAVVLDSHDISQFDSISLLEKDETEFKNDIAKPIRIINRSHTADERETAIIDDDDVDMFNPTEQKICSTKRNSSLNSNEIDDSNLPTQPNPFLAKKHKLRERRNSLADDEDVDIIESTDPIFHETEPKTINKKTEADLVGNKCLPIATQQARCHEIRDPTTFGNNKIITRGDINSRAVIEKKNVDLCNKKKHNAIEDTQKNLVPDSLPFSELIYHKGSYGNTFNSTALTEVLDTQNRDALEKECAELQKKIEIAENKKKESVEKDIQNHPDSQGTVIEASEDEDESEIAPTPPNSLPNGEFLSQSILGNNSRHETTAADSQLSEIPATLAAAEQISKIQSAIMKSATPFAVPTPLKNRREQNKSVQPVRAKGGYSFVFSRLSDAHLKDLKRFALIIKADITSDIVEKTTHIIIKPDEGNKAPHTFKYLKGVAKRLWIVSIEWVSASLRAKRLLLEDKFVVLDASGEPGPWRCRNVSELPLSNFIIVPLPPYNTIKPDQLDDLLSLCGAEIAHDMESLKTMPLEKPRVLLTDGELEVGTIERFLEELLAVPVNVEWLLDVVGHYELVPLSPFLHTPIQRDILQYLGIADHLIVDDSEDEAENEEEESK